MDKYRSWTEHFSKGECFQGVTKTNFYTPQSGILAEKDTTAIKTNWTDLQWLVEKAEKEKLLRFCRGELNNIYLGRPERACGHSTADTMSQRCPLPLQSLVVISWNFLKGWFLLWWTISVRAPLVSLTFYSIQLKDLQERIEMSSTKNSGVHLHEEKVSLAQWEEGDSHSILMVDGLLNPESKLTWNRIPAHWYRFILVPCKWLSRGQTATELDAPTVDDLLIYKLVRLT